VSDSEKLTLDERWLRGTGRVPDQVYETARALAGTDKRSIEEALLAARGRVAGPFGASTRLGVPRSTLESRIRNFRIDKTRFRRPSQIAVG